MNVRLVIRAFILPAYVMTRQQYAVRLGLFLAFSCLVYFSFFRPFPPGSSFHQSVADAANLGYPLHIYKGPHPLPAREAVDASQFDPLYGNDAGPEITISVISMIGRAVRSTYQVTPRAAVVAIFILFLLLGLIFVMPPLPPLATVLAMIAIYMLTKDHGGRSFIQGSVVRAPWLMAWMPLLVAVYFMFCALQNRRSPVYWITLVGFSFAMSYLTLWREELLGSIYFFAMSSVALSIILLTSILSGDGTDPVGRRLKLVNLAKSSLPAAILIAVVVVTKWVVLLLFYWTSATSLAQTQVPVHGSGLPLYLGLGFADNPFNISWRDSTGFQHFFLLRNTADWPVPTTLKLIHDTLEREWRHIVINEPFEFARGLWHKAAFMHHFYLHPRIDASNVRFFQSGLVVPPSVTQIYWIFLIAMSVLFARSLMGRARDVAMFVGAMGVCAGGFVGPLLIYPGYLLGSTSAMLSVSLFLLPQVLVLHYDRAHWLNAMAGERKGETRLRTAYWCWMLIGLAGVALWLSITFIRNAQTESRIVHASAGETLRDMDHRYAWHFNQLSRSDQEGVIRRLWEHQDRRVYRGSQAMAREVTSPIDWYQPIVAVKWEKGFNLIAFMSKEWQRTEAEIDQGRVNTRIQFAMGGPHFGRLEYGTSVDLASTTMLEVNDAEWKDSYKMISVPILGRPGADDSHVEVDAFEDLTSTSDTRLVGKSVLSNKEH